MSRFPPHGADAIALWVTFTYTLEAASTAPILGLLSPEKRCGKTKTMELLAELVPKPVSSSNISPAALFRLIDEYTPTLLIDEGDTFLGFREELRGILNSGHTRTTAFVLRVEGNDHEPRAFSTWGAKVFAQIGHLPETLADRSIIIPMRRRTPA